MATPSNLAMIKKLQIAINMNFDEKLTYNTTQFWSEQEKRIITMYVIRKAVPRDSEGRKKNYYIKLFTVASQLQIVFFLRDYWYKLNEWELPTDNEIWNEVREKIEIFNDWDSYRKEIADKKQEV